MCLAHTRIILMTIYPRIDPENAQVDTVVRLLGPSLVLGRTEAKSARKQ